VASQLNHELLLNSGFRLSLENKGSRVNGDYLPPWLIQLTGLILLIAVCIYWAFTENESALIMSGVMSLILVGAYKSTKDTAARDRRKDSEENGE
jgi:hypothetical protein